MRFHAGKTFGSLLCAVGEDSLPPPAGPFDIFSNMPSRVWNLLVDGPDWLLMTLMSTPSLLPNVPSPQAMAQFLSARQR